METIRITLSRAKLTDDFRVDEQDIATSYKLVLGHVLSLEHKVNEHCKDLEKFKVAAKVELKAVLHYCQSTLISRVYATLNQIYDYEGTALLEKPEALKS